MTQLGKPQIINVTQKKTCWLVENGINTKQIHSQLIAINKVRRGVGLFLQSLLYLTFAGVLAGNTCRLRKSLRTSTDNADAGSVRSCKFITTTSLSILPDSAPIPKVFFEPGAFN